MDRIKKRDAFRDFLVKNGFLIIQDDYDCIILTGFLSSIKENYDRFVSDTINKAGFKKITTPLLVHEDLFLSKFNDIKRNESLKEPALLYLDGRRLHKAYVLSSELTPFSALIFKRSVHSHVDLPLLYYSQTVTIKPDAELDSHNSFEIKVIELV